MPIRNIVSFARWAWRAAPLKKRSCSNEMLFEFTRYGFHLRAWYERSDGSQSASSSTTI